MNPMLCLLVASELASKLHGEPQEYCLAAVGMRRDGAIVHATNKAVRVKSAKGTTPERLPSTHAEMRLCRKMDAEGSVFVARVLRDGTWGSARPCPRCLSFMRSRRVRDIYYTIASQEYGCIKL